MKEAIFSGKMQITYLHSACYLYWHIFRQLRLYACKKAGSRPYLASPSENRPNPPFWQIFQAPPAELYDLETIAGQVFQAFTAADWQKLNIEANNLKEAWDTARPLAGNKLGVSEADKELKELLINIREQKTAATTLKSLNKFMKSVSLIGKSYKLSPLSDLAALGSTLRAVA